MDLDARWELNSRVLRRFDSKFSQIVHYADQGQNRDRRTLIPLPAILNRNDPDNFSIGITPEDDIELSNEFIIYRPGQTDKSSTESTDIYGIWIFEPSQLEQLSNTIKRYDRAFINNSCQESASSATIQGTEQTESTAVDLDSLFQFGSPKDTHMGHAYTESERNGASILNALFQEAAPQKAATQSARKSSDPSSAKSDSSSFSPSLSQSHEQASKLHDSSEKQSKTAGRDNERSERQIGTDEGASSISLEDLFGGLKQATIGSEPIYDPSQGDTNEEPTPGKSATRRDKDLQADSDNINTKQASPVEESRQESQANQGHEQTKYEPSRAQVTPDDASGTERESDSSNRPEQTPKPDQTPPCPRAETNLLSILSKAKAPEKLASEKKQLSRVEFVQTMTEQEYVDQLYARYLSAQH